MLSLTLATQFDLITAPSPTFVPTAFEFVPFENLISRCPPCPFLTDLIGQAVSISDPEYMDATHGIALTQSVVLRATTSAGLTVTLWADFSKVIDPSILAIEDASSPVVIAFGGLIVWHFNSVVSVKSSTATRIMVNPLVPETRILQEM
ncbi:hypothetical protein LINGRAHAP2_LOCUS13593 [Linum grandiflorum]